MPRDHELLSLAGVLVELSYSPVFYVPVAFGIFWSLLGLRVRPPRPPSRSDRWASAPLLVWALFADRGAEFYFTAGHFDYASRGLQLQILWVASWVLLISLLLTLATTIPTLLHDRRSHQRLGLELVALVPVLVVLVDWIFFCPVLSTA